MMDLTFFYQPTFDTLELNEVAFLHCIKFFEYKMKMKFNKDPLALELKNYLTKIVNVYSVYELNAWPRNSTNISGLRIAYLERLI